MKIAYGNYIVQNNYMALIHADEASTMNEEDALIGGEFFIHV